MPLLNLSISQFLWVFIATNLLLKLSPCRLFLRWLASGGLTCYKIPTNDELRPLKSRGGGGGAGGGGSDGKKRGKSRGGAKSTSSGDQPVDGRAIGPNEFRIRSLDLTKLSLNKVQIDSGVLLTAPYGEELEWVADLACMSLISFILTQLMFYYSPRGHEYNFSLVWILLVVAQCLLILARLTAIYFRNQVSIGERSLCIVSGCLFLLVAMIILALDGTRLELMVNESLRSLGSKNPFALPRQPNKDALLDPEEFDTPPPMPPGAGPSPASIILVKLVIAVICALVGVIFTFPGLRYGQLHESLVASVTTSKLQKILCHLNFISPILVICLWVPAVSRNLFKRLPDDRLPFPADDEHFELLRLAAYLGVDLLRLLAVRHYVQTFLLSGSSRLESIRHRGGITTNKEVQLAVASMNNYANVACMQYILPALVCLFTAIMHATLHLYNKEAVDSHGRDDATTSTKQLASLRFLFGTDQQALVERAEESLDQLRRLVASEFIKNMLGFAAWWFHFAWCCTSTVGVVYHKYFTH